MTITAASIAVIKGIVSGKAATWIAWSFPVLATLAVSEAFIGDLLVALLAAIPTTLTGIVALIVVLKKQEKIAEALDGKLSELVAAKTDVARAQGKEQERTEERERVAEAAPIVAAVIAQAAAEAVKSDPDKVSKMEIVNKDENAIPTRPAKPSTENQEK